MTIHPPNPHHERLRRHLIALTMGTPVSDADHHRRIGPYTPRHQALLDELADYVAGASRTGGVSGANRFGCRLPISINALEIQESIRSTITPATRSTRGASLKSLVSTWVREQEDKGKSEEALAVTTSWIRAIVALRHPVHDLRATCSQCGKHEVVKTGCDGSGPLRKPALCYTVERATCRSCSARWEGLDGMRGLALLLSAQEVERP